MIGKLWEVGSLNDQDIIEEYMILFAPALAAAMAKATVGVRVWTAPVT